ncbi:MAG: hypothetical protein PF495_20815, partial [Spirochaetales bacterium]|nr:hypothetical protein [Spirochaetales bacterium]
IFCVLFFITQESFAGFKVVPTQFFLGVAREKSETRVIKVHNTGDTPLSLEIYMRDFIREINGKEKEVMSGTVEGSCAKWIRLSPLKLELAPNETKTVSFTMSVPKEGVGSYWTNIFVDQTSKPKPRVTKKGKTSFQVFVKMRYRIRVFQEVPGTLEKRGRIVDMTARPYEQKDSLVVDVVFENTGNSVLHPGGKVEIKDENGETVKTLSLINKEDPPFQVYPGSKRIVQARTKEKLASGHYVALAIIDYGGEDLVAGEMEFEVK